MVVLCCLLFLCGCKDAQASEITTVYNGEEYSYTEKNNLTQEMNKAKTSMDAAHTMAEGARGLGYSETSEIVLLAKDEWGEAYDIYITNKNIINQLNTAYRNSWADERAQYPIATEVWLYLKGLGYNDYVCAGILGNMMAEVGGQTLNLKHMSRGSYFGLCQWSKSYSGVWGASLSGQLAFLKKTIGYEFNTYGSKYKSGFNYNQFLQLKNEKQAALAFAKCYERCDSASYNVRQQNATKALKYFAN